MKDSVSAFPIFDNMRVGQDYGCTDNGMTLRDWFAGQAFVAITHPVTHLDELESLAIDECRLLARAAYAIADAMIAERNKGGDK
jgi:hypothetical protein